MADKSGKVREEKRVSLTIDGVQLEVPQGMNLIEAGRTAGIEIPYYCYHRHLSVAGNCRMCQVEIEGTPKLTIACNTAVQEGMIVLTHRTSQRVADAQRATLEFLLVNHPLDCTVCDQAGHCKLQDYYYEYNAQGSRFIDQKVRKVKAKPLGPEIVYDGERCILCTRCVRFCEEVTKTSELAVLNRGDLSVIDVEPGRPLDNPLAGTVVDLCPVGALTHRQWRFNTRIWFTEEMDSICTGCSTGCNAKIATRDNKIVFVKARLNSEVNQEWMCDQGRYGFNRFQPENRLNEPLLRDQLELVPASLEDACQQAAKLTSPTATSETAVFLSPLLTLEELWVSLTFARKVMGILWVEEGNECLAMQLRKRELTEVEKVLVSPDFAANARGLHLLGWGAGKGDWREELESSYDRLLQRVRLGQVKRILLIGDQAILTADLDQEMINALLDVEVSVALTPRGLVNGEEAVSGPIGAHQLCRVLLPSHTVNEKSGIMVNQQMRLQRLSALLSPPANTYPQWMLLRMIAKAAGKVLMGDAVDTERALFQEMIKQHKPFSGLSLAKIGPLGLARESMVQKEETE